MEIKKTEKKIGDKVYWSAQRAAEYIGVGYSSLRRQTTAKKVTHLKHCGTMWFLKEWLDAYISRSTISGSKS